MRLDTQLFRWTRLEVIPKKRSLVKVDKIFTFLHSRTLQDLWEMVYMMDPELMEKKRGVTNNAK